jgi:hypothetical protein
MATEYSVEREIAAPVDRVWTLLADANSYARWNGSLLSIEGEIVEGGTLSLVPRANPGRTFKLRVSLRASQLEPSTTGWLGSGSPPRVHGRSRQRPVGSPAGLVCARQEVEATAYRRRRAYPPRTSLPPPAHRRTGGLPQAPMVP